MPRRLEDAILLAISMFSLPAALDFLTDMIARKDAHARAALTALAIHRHHAKIKEGVAAAVAGNGDPDVAAWFWKKFSDAPERGNEER